MREDTLSAPDSLKGFGTSKEDDTHKRGERGKRHQRANPVVEAPIMAAVAVVKAPDVEDIICVAADEV